MNMKCINCNTSSDSCYSFRIQGRHFGIFKDKDLTFELCQDCIYNLGGLKYISSLFYENPKYDKDDLNQENPIYEKEYLLEELVENITNKELECVLTCKNYNNDCNYKIYEICTNYKGE